MADENEIGMDVTIRTRSAGDGGDATVAKLEEVKQQAVETAGALEDLNLQKLQEFQDANDKMGVGGTQINATEIARTRAEAAASMREEAEAEEEITDLQRQQQAIYATKLEAIQEEAAGRMAEAVALREEVELLEAALELQRKLGVSEEESLALARETLEAKRLIAEQAEAQQALNDELIAQEAALNTEAEESVSLRGFGPAGRIAGMFGGGDVGFLVTILALLAGAFSKLSEEANKYIESLGKIRDNSEQAKDKLHAMSDEVRGAASEQGKWNDQLKVTTAALDGEEKALDRTAQAQDRLAAAQKALALARIDADKSLTTDQKDDAKAKVDEQYDDAEARNKEERDTKQIQLEADRVRAANIAQSQAAIRAAAAKKQADDAIAAADAARKENEAKQKQAALLNYESRGLTGAMNAIEDAGDLEDPTQLKAQARAARTEAADAKRKLAEAEKAAAEAKKASVEAYRAAQDSVENYRRQLAASEEKIKDLQSDRATTGSVAGIQDEAAGYQDTARKNKADEIAAAKAKREADEAARKQAELERQNAELADKAANESQRADELLRELGEKQAQGVTIEPGAGSRKGAGKLYEAKQLLAQHKSALEAQRQADSRDRIEDELLTLMRQMAEDSAALSRNKVSHAELDAKLAQIKGIVGNNRQ
jgi:hypothetical protein